jgi:type IV secretion system protein VirD4
MNNFIITTITVIEYIFSAIGEVFNFCASLFHKEKPFHAKFGNESSISSVFNKGFVLFNRKRLSRKASFQNLMISGPTGSGKTVKLIIKTLLELRNCSIIVTDPSGELYLLLSGFLSRFFKIIVLNPTNSLESAGYNLLSRIKKPNDVDKLASLIATSTLEKGSGGDQFWVLSTKSMLSIFIRLVLYQEPEFRHMRSVTFVLNSFASNPKRVDEWIVKTGDKALIEQYKALIANSEKTLQSIVASGKAALSLFEDEEIAKTTSIDTIDLDEFRKTPTIIFIHSGVQEMKYTSMLFGIFFEQVFTKFLEKLPEKSDLPVFIILEEASSIYIPLLPLALANLRKYRVGTMLCLQQGNTQLKKLYGDVDADNIQSNCRTQLFLPGITDMQTLKMIETLGGKTVYKDKEGREHSKSLISAEEVRMLPDNKVIVIHENKPLVKGTVKPYFKSLKYRQYAKIPPVVLEQVIPDSPVPLFD